MLTSDKGYTLVELLIAMAIVGIVLTGMYDLVVSSSRIYLAQNAIVEMQADSRAAMDFMVRELRLACNKPPCTPPTISSTRSKLIRSASTVWRIRGMRQGEVLVHSMIVKKLESRRI